MNVAEVFFETDANRWESHDATKYTLTSQVSLTGMDMEAEKNEQLTTIIEVT